MITAMTMMRSWAIWFKSIKAQTGCMCLGYALDINSWLLHHYSNAMWDSLRLKSLTIRVFVQKYDKANSKDDIKDLHYWLFEKGTHRWPLDSSHKDPVMQKACRQHGPTDLMILYLVFLSISMLGQQSFTKRLAHIVTFYTKLYLALRELLLWCISYS